jgi:hypothetical protein
MIKTLNKPGIEDTLNPMKGVHQKLTGEFTLG